MATYSFAASLHAMQCWVRGLRSLMLSLLTLLTLRPALVTPMPIARYTLDRVPRAVVSAVKLQLTSRCHYLGVKILLRYLQ
jgi:hypothetical protein